MLIDRKCWLNLVWVSSWFCLGEFLVVCQKYSVQPKPCPLYSIKCYIIIFCTSRICSKENLEDENNVDENGNFDSIIKICLALV